eukprot:1157372-Pelagomonas_calceolata.AAC.2
MPLTRDSTPPLPSLPADKLPLLLGLLPVLSLMSASAEVDEGRVWGPQLGEPKITSNWGAVSERLGALHAQKK